MLMEVRYTNGELGCAENNNNAALLCYFTIVAAQEHNIEHAFYSQFLFLLFRFTCVGFAYFCYIPKCLSEFLKKNM